MNENENPQVVVSSFEPLSGPSWFTRLLHKFMPPDASFARKTLVIGVPVGVVLALVATVAVFSAVNLRDQKQLASTGDAVEGQEISSFGIRADSLRFVRDPAEAPSGDSASNPPSGGGDSGSGGGSAGSSGTGSGGSSSSGRSSGGASSNSGGSSGGSNAGGGSSSGGGSSGGGGSSTSCALPNYPNANCTGWQHTGVTLSAYTGPTTINTAGTVIDGKDIQACLTVNANNVTIKRSKVSCGSWAGVRMYGTNGLIEDTEVNMLGFTGANCLTGNNYTGRRVNCHNTGDGIRLGTNVTIEDSFVHGLVTTQGSHNDGMQALGGDNITIRHNSIENQFTQTSCIILGQSSGPLSNVLIENNLFNGGGYTVYGGGTHSDVSGIKFLNNRFKRGPAGFYPNGGHFGPVAHYDPTRPGNQWSGNAWHDNGEAIVR